MAAGFQALLDRQGRAEPVPGGHEVVDLVDFHIDCDSNTPLHDLSQGMYCISVLEKISWVEDQDWEYEVFLSNEISCKPDTKQVWNVTVKMLLTSAATSLYLIRWG